MTLAEAIYECRDYGVIYRTSKPYNMYWRELGDLIGQIASRDAGGLHADDWRVRARI